MDYQRVKMKDSQGRYILQPDMTIPSGDSLFGAPLLVGRRNQVTTQWEKFDFYSQGLTVIVRNDYQKIDEEAVRYIEFTPTTGE